MKIKIMIVLIAGTLIITGSMIALGNSAEDGNEVVTTQEEQQEVSTKQEYIEQNIEPRPIRVEGDGFTSVNIIEKERRERYGKHARAKTESANLHEFISNMHQAFSEMPDHEKERYEPTGHDEWYYFYLQSMALENGMRYIEVNGEKIETYYEELRKLSTIIQEEHLNNDDLPTKQMKEAIEDVRRVLADINKYINE